jgi:Ca2+-binding EF-hand superfamily protein
MARFLSTLDDHLKAENSKLQQVFNEFDLDGSGQLDRREMARMITRLMPELDSRCDQQCADCHCLNTHAGCYSVLQPH